MILECLEQRTLLAAPVVASIPDQSVAVNAGLALAVSASDADNVPAGTDPINLSAQLATGGLLPSWLTFTPGAPGSGLGNFSVTAGSGPYGSIDVKVTATDSTGATGSDTFTIVATEGTLTSTTITNQVVGVHTPFSLPVASHFTDTDLDTLTYSATQADGSVLPAWLTFSSATGTFSGTPLDADIGVVNVKVTATDDNPAGFASTIQTFTITVPLNHTPQFTAGADQSKTYSDFLQSFTVAGWATNILKGPSEEAGQTLTFMVTTDNDALFSTLPAIDATTGTLTYTLAGGKLGTANVTVKLKDNGGSASGGNDTSDPQVFFIAITTTTDPSITVAPIANQVVGVHTPFELPVFGTFTETDPGDKLTLTATLLDGSVLPTWLTFTPGTPVLVPTGTFTGTPLDADIGSIDVTLTATDLAGNKATDTFRITVPINHTPQFTAGVDQSVTEDAAAQSVVGWATGILAGPPTESEQELNFIVTTNNDSLFSVLPAVDPTTGTLTYTLASNANGTAVVTVKLHDNGGSASGGVDTSDAQTFNIVVAPANDAPSFTLAGNPAASNEDAGPQSVAGFASNISAGPSDESTQTLTFSLTPTGGGLTFAAGPSIDPTTGTLTYEAAADSNGTATFDVQLLDNGVPVGTSATASFTITVNPVNDAPSLTLSTSSLSVAEDAGLQSVAGFVATTSVGPADESSQVITKFTVTQTANTGLTFLTAPSIDPVTGNLTYQAATNSNGTATFSVTATDDGGTANGGVDTSAALTFIISAAGVNDAPTISVPAAQTTLEDTSKAIVGLSFGDVDSGTSDVTVTLSAASGTVTVSTNVAGGLTAAQVSGNGTAAVTITAPLAVLNITLADPAGLTYLPGLNFNGSDTLTIGISDNGNTGSGGVKTASATVGITVTPVNDAPTFAILSNPPAVAEDAGPQSVAAFASSISVGPANEVGQTITKFTVTQTASTGGLTFLTAPSIDPLTGNLTYQTTTNSNGTATFSVTMSDDGGTANGGVDTSISHTFIVLVTGVNDAPTISAPGPQTTLEDTSKAIVGLSFGDVDAAPSDVTVTLSAVSGTVTVSTNVAGGLTAAQVSGNGTASLTISAPLAALNTTLASATGLTYLPNADFNGSDTLTVGISDNGNTGTGGVKTASTTVAVTVTAVNDAPTFAILSNPPVVNEDAGAQSVASFASSISVGPANESTQIVTKFTVTQTASTGGLSFLTAPSIDPLTGNLTYQTATNSNGTATFSVTMSDDGGTANGGVDTSISHTFIILVTGVNDTPTISSPGPQTTLEDTSKAILGLSFGDVDVASSDVTVTFSAVSGTVTVSTNVTGGLTAAQVSSNGTALVTITASLAALNTTLASATGLTYLPNADFNGGDTLTIGISDNGNTGTGGAKTASATVAISVTPVNDAPTFTIVSNPPAVAEDAGPQSVAAFASSISVGPANEVGQTITKFTVTQTASSGLTFLTAPSIDLLTGNLTYQAAANSSGTATFSVTMSDDGGTTNGGVDTSVAHTFIISVTAVNDAPTISAPGPQTTLEDTSKVILGLSFGDIDVASSDVTVTLSAASGTVTVSTNVVGGLTAAQVSGNGTASVTITAPLAALNTTLISVTGLTYLPNLNFNGSDTLTIGISDNGNTGSGGVKTASATVAISVTPVNDAPTFTISNPPAVVEDAGPQTVAGFASSISVGPANEIGQTITKFTVTQTASTGGLTFLTAPSIDPLTGNLTYQAATNSNGTATFSVTMSDDGGTANGGVDTSITQTFIVSIIAVNDAPTISAPGAQTTLEDTSKVILGLSFGDVDAGSSNVTVTLSAANGTSTVSTNVVGGLTAAQVSGNGTASVTITAPLAALNLTLASATGLTYLPNADFNGSDTLTVGISDNGNTGTGGTMTASATVAIDVTPVNDAPTFTFLSNPPAVNEDAGPQTVVGFASSISVGPANESAQKVTKFTVTQTAATGLTFLTAPSIDPLTGNLTYQTATNSNGTATFSVTMSDDGGITNGGVDTSVAHTFIISITGVNDAPTISSPGPQTTLEDSSKAILGLSFGDVDAGSSDVTVTLSAVNGTILVSTNVLTGLTATQVTGNGTAAVTITAPLAALNWTLADPVVGLLYLPNANFNGSDTLTIGISDNGNTGTGGVKTASTTVAITVTPVNDAPSFTLSSGVLTAAEDAGLQTVAAFATSITKGPANESSQTITNFTITQTASTGGLTFFSAPSIDPVTGNLTYQSTANANGTATFSVTMTDDGGTANGGIDTSIAHTFIISVTPVNDAPSFTLAGNPAAVNEDAGPQTVAGFASSMSPGPANEAGQLMTFNITPTGTTGGLTFLTAPSIDPITGTLTYQAAADSNGTATFSVTLSDDGSAVLPNVNTSAAQTFTITITPVNDAPSFTIASNPPTVNEDAGLQTVASFATSISAGPANELGQTLTFNVTETGNTGLTFLTAPSINATTGTLTYKAAANSNGTATFSVTLSDNGGTANGGVDTSATQTFTIAVIAVNDGPTITVPGAQTTPEDESLVISGLSFADIDAGSSDVTVTLTVSHGTLTLNTTVTDGLIASQISGNGTATVTITAPLAAVNATLADVAGLTYLPNLNDNGADTIAITIDDNGNTGTGGAKTASASIAITVTSINDAPSFSKGASWSDLEVGVNDGPQTIAGWVTGISPGPANESGQTITFLVTTDNPGLFSVLPEIALDGTLTFTPLEGFGGTATVTVKLHDNGGTANGGVDTSDAQTFTITSFVDDVTYSAVGGAKLKAVVVNGLLTVQIGGVPYSSFQTAQIETLTLNGGSSNDEINLSGLSPLLYPKLKSIVINGGAGKDSVTMTALSTNSFTSMDSVTINGDAGDDAIKLTGLPTSLFPNLTSFVLNGGAGNDTIFGSNFAEKITGGLGNDSLRGGGGTDRLVETADANFKLTNTTLTGVGSDKLSGFEEASLTGGAKANKLDASAFTGKVTLSGGAGNDTLLGGSGDDALVGGDGNDSLSGGAGSDTLIGGAGNDKLKGGAGDDLLIGGFGVDSLDGEAGSDTGLGGQGKSGAPRLGNSVKDAGDVFTSIETINEVFATLFAFE